MGTGKIESVRTQVLCLSIANPGSIADCRVWLTKHVYMAVGEKETKPSPSRSMPATMVCVPGGWCANVTALRSWDEMHSNNTPLYKISTSQGLPGGQWLGTLLSLQGQGGGWEDMFHKIPHAVWCSQINKLNLNGFMLKGCRLG